ncbi:MAG: DMT family transporter [Steroidobacteraceae bacterium]|nr:DMT family transporter [Steroidobacteraceae bacterium]
MPEGQPGSARFAPCLVLAVALLAVSHGAIFARLADAAPLAIAAWRLGIACLVALPVAAMARPAVLPGRALALAAGAGALLALHFATWIASLDYTTIARSVLLVSTAPVWVAVIEAALGRGIPARAMLAALAAAIAGAAIVGSEGLGGAASTGDLLAVAGAMAMAGYLLLSRAAQATLPFRAYLGIAYGTAAALLWIAMLATGTQALGFGPGTWWALAGMAFVSQLIGHGGYNWALRHLAPLFVAIVLVGEPVLASLLGWWLLDEAPGWRTAAGGLLILAGIALAAGPGRRA